MSTRECSYYGRNPRVRLARQRALLRSDLANHEPEQNIWRRNVHEILVVDAGRELRRRTQSARVKGGTLGVRCTVLSRIRDPGLWLLTITKQTICMMYPLPSPSERDQTRPPHPINSTEL